MFHVPPYRPSWCSSKGSLQAGGRRGPTVQRAESPLSVCLSAGLAAVRMVGVASGTKRQINLTHSSARQVSAVECAKWVSPFLSARARERVKRHGSSDTGDLSFPVDTDDDSGQGAFRQGTTTAEGRYSSVVSTRVAPTDRHSSWILRDESCRTRVQALNWQTHGRPDARHVSALPEIGGLVGFRRAG